MTESGTTLSADVVATPSLSIYREKENEKEKEKKKKKKE
jgi:hypothetical protein